MYNCKTNCVAWEDAFERMLVGRRVDGDLIILHYICNWKVCQIFLTISRKFSPLNEEILSRVSIPMQIEETPVRECHVWSQRFLLPFFLSFFFSFLLLAWHALFTRQEKGKSSAARELITVHGTDLEDFNRVP